MLRKASLPLGDQAYDQALGQFNSALARLLRAAAPDLAAVAGKLDLILRHGVFELSFGEACLEALGRDIRGFAADAARASFRPRG